MDESNGMANSSSASPFDRLPDDCIIAILSRLGAVVVTGLERLDPETLAVEHPLHGGLVCRRWQSLAHHAVRSLQLQDLTEGVKCLRTLSALACLELRTYRTIPLQDFERVVDLTPHLERLDLADPVRKPISAMEAAGKWTRLQHLCLKRELGEHVKDLLPGVCKLPLEQLSIHYAGADPVAVCSGLAMFTGLVNLKLTCSDLPPGLCPRSLRTLQLVRFEGSSLPESLAQLTGLESFRLICAPKLGALPESLGLLARLTKLDIDRCDGLRSLPSAISDCESLRVLSVQDCKRMQPYTDSLWSLQGLQELRSVRNSRRGRGHPELLSGLTGLASLASFHMDYFETLPEDVGSMSRLRELHLNCSRVFAVSPRSPRWRDVSPSALCWLGSLETLGLGSGVCLAMLPRDLGLLTGLNLEVDERGRSALTGLRCLSESLGQLRALRTLTLCDLPSILLLPNSSYMRQSQVTLEIRECEVLGRQGMVDPLEKVMVEGCPCLAREDGECLECCECCDGEWWWFRVEEA